MSLNPLPCDAPGCSNPRRGEGGAYCNKHRIQIRRHGRLTPDREVGVVTSTCVIKDCSRPVHGKNLCKAHYGQVGRGDPITEIGKYGKFCMVATCDQTASGKNLCSTHYSQYKNGRALYPTTRKGGLGVCLEPGCRNSSHSKGLCHLHYAHRKMHKKTFTSGDIQCVVCGETRGTQRCHVIPRKEGGTWDYQNLLPLCPTHHWCFDHGLLDAQELLHIEQSCE